MKSSHQHPQPAPLEGPEGYPFPKNQEGLLPWSRALEQLERSRYFWLATVRPDGRPHVAPLWGVWIDDALYFDGSPTTQWARNIVKNPAATVHLESGDDVVIVEGIVEGVVTDGDLAFRIIEVWKTKYGRFEPEPATRGMFRLRARVARAWSSELLADGTRWFFRDF